MYGNVSLLPNSDTHVRIFIGISDPYAPKRFMNIFGVYC